MQLTRAKPRKPKVIRRINDVDLILAMDKAGVVWHSSGYLSKTRENGRKVRTHDYYKTDSLTDAQRAALLELFPSLEIFGSQSEYSPEIRGVVIGSPKAARLRELNAGIRA